MNKFNINIVIKFNLYIFLIFLLTFCNNFVEKNVTNINGFDKITWNANIESLKNVLNKEYSANLYSYYKVDGSDSLLYLFNFGKFKGMNVYKWKVIYFKDRLTKIVIYLDNKIEIATVYKNLFGEELKKNANSDILERVLKLADSNKNASNVIINNKDKKTLIVLINANN